MVRQRTRIGRHLATFLLSSVSRAPIILLLTLVLAVIMRTLSTVALVALRVAVAALRVSGALIMIRRVLLTSILMILVILRYSTMQFLSRVTARV